MFSGSKLFLRLASGDYLCLRGVCLEIEKAKLGRQSRRMAIDIESKRMALQAKRLEFSVTLLQNAKENISKKKGESLCYKPSSQGPSYPKGLTA